MIGTDSEREPQNSVLSAWLDDDNDDSCQIPIIFRFTGPIDGTLTGVTTPGQSGLGSNYIKGVFI